tara:strand:- start:794 stop:2431 length:1638 start_codon:yes stop_codon:yes gene_type:complete
MIKYDLSFILKLSLFVIVLIAIFYIYNVTNITKKEHFEDKESVIDPIIPNQILYWNERKKGINQIYETDKFLELDAQGNLNLTSREDTYKKYTLIKSNPNYYGPLKINNKNVSIEGHDLESYENISLEECKYKCDDNDFCQGLSYKDNECILKKHTCDYVPNDCKENDEWDAYEKLETNNKLIEYAENQNSFTEPQIGTNIEGHDIENGVYNNIDLPTCLNKCINNPMCASVVYRPTERKCWLKEATCERAGSSCKSASGFNQYDIADIGQLDGYVKMTLNGGKNAALSGHNLKKVEVASISKCQAACEEQRKYGKEYHKCRGIEWNVKDRTCMLSTAVCRLTSDCELNDNFISYERRKFLGPFWIQSREYPTKYIRPISDETLEKKDKADIIGVSSKKDKYAQWYYHSDKGLQNVGNNKWFARGYDRKWKIRAYRWRSRYSCWDWKKRSDTWGNIYPLEKNGTRKKGDWFLYIPENSDEVTIIQERNRESWRNPNYVQCKNLSTGKKVSSSGGAEWKVKSKISKSEHRAMWKFVPVYPSSDIII